MIADAKNPTLEWYSVRSIVRSQTVEDGSPRTVFEERVVLVKAASFDEAIAKGEAEAKEYCAICHRSRVLDYLVAYYIGDEEELRRGEVWSSMRDSELSDGDFLTHFYAGESYSSAMP